MGLKPASLNLYSHGGYAVYAHHISLRNQSAQSVWSVLRKDSTVVAIFASHVLAETGGMIV
jgi:hypothetical protein